MSSRFTLATLLMLTTIVAATTNLAFTLYRESRPIEWGTFTYTKAEALQRDGRTVLFFGIATYHVESQWIRRQLDDSRLALAAHRGEIVPLMRTYADWDDPEILAVWNRFGHTKRPMLLLFAANGAVTRIEPWHIKNLDRQFESRSAIPAMPLLWFVGTLLACAWMHFYKRKSQNQAMAATSGLLSHRAH